MTPAPPAPMQPFLDRLLPRLRLGDFAAAGLLVEAVAQGEPALHALGLAAVALRRKEARPALEHAARAHALRPDAPEPLEYLAMASLALGLAEDAERHARQAVERGGGRRGLVGLGGILLGTGRAAEAEQAYRAALIDDPRDPQALSGVATALHRQQDLDGALRYFAAAFEASPLDPAPVRSLINMYAEAGRLLGALAAASVVRDQPRSDSEQVILDVLLLQLTRLVLRERPVAAGGDAGVDDTVAHLLATARRRPPGLRLGVCRALLDVDRPREAQQLLASLDGEALSAEDRGNALYIAGLLRATAGDPAAALDRYRSALDVDPRRWDACCNAVSILLERGDAAALAEIEVLLGRVPEETRLASPALLLNQAVFWNRTGKVAAARENLRAVLSYTGGEGDLAAIARQILDEA